jgi:2-haloacid dehalogenase
MVDLARRNGFAWDAILGAEFARDYKPKPVVYLAAVAALDCAPNEVMMVAAHPSDLAAAAGAVLRTAFGERPDEFGPGQGDSLGTARPDHAVTSVTALADALGA